MRTRNPTRRGFGHLLGMAVSLTSLLTNTTDAAGAGFGRSPTAAEIASVDIDVKPDGSGLPAGSGTAGAGEKLYATQCAACHGSTGVEGPRDRLVGGRGSLATAQPLKTVGSYWQYAPTLYDYINRAMPFTAPGTLKPDEVYSLVAFLLNRNGVIGDGEVIDQTSLPLVKMPNRDGFVVEPEFRNLTRK
jgi:S-disulfanyl-L-cysteine oxidoreductase SoxD